jgi:hypothetical protein
MTLMASKTQPPQQPADPKADAERLAVLLKKAMEQPGVREVMEIYGGSAKATEAVNAYQIYQNPYPTNTVSSSSEPSVF